MKTLRAALPMAALVAGWQVLSALSVLPDHKIPSPWEVIHGLKDLATIGLPRGHLLTHHAAMSLLRVVLGFSIAALLGIPLGIAVGRSKRFRRAVSPILELLRPIPPLAWIPIAILWFGIGIKSAVFIIFLGAFFPILLNAVSGVESVPPITVEAARTLGAGRTDLLFKVFVPGAMPSILTGMRIGLGIGWMTLVAAEFTGVKSGLGLGYMIMTARDIQRVDELVAGMAVIGFVGIAMDKGLRLVEANLLRWRETV